MMLLGKNGSHGTDGLGFVAIKSGGMNDGFEFLRRDGSVVRRGAASIEECRGHHVDTDIGALGREDGGHQKFERVGEIQFAVGIGVDFWKFHREEFGPLSSCHGVNVLAGSLPGRADSLFQDRVSLAD